MDDIVRIKKFIPIMNEVSPTFCMAKWHHTTIYLQTGETHSCYHPPPHKTLRAMFPAKFKSAHHAPLRLGTP